MHLGQYDDNMRLIVRQIVAATKFVRELPRIGALKYRELDVGKVNTPLNVTVRIDCAVDAKFPFATYDSKSTAEPRSDASE